MHESPDIVISSGHFRLRCRSLRWRNARTRFLGLPLSIKGSALGVICRLGHGLTCPPRVSSSFHHGRADHFALSNPEKLGCSLSQLFGTGLTALPRGGSKRVVNYGKLPGRDFAAS